MEFIKSPNYNARPGGIRIWTVVVHASANSTLGGLIAWFQSPTAQVSAHYCIGKDGRVVQMVQEADRAWHAGHSQWKGIENVNDFSIGIELVNLNDGQDPYPAPQIDALVSLLRDLCQRYGISRDNVVRHADVNTAKDDPRGLDMNRIRAKLDTSTGGFIHGLHAGSCANGWESTGASLMIESPGTILFTEIAYTQTGQDYRPWSNLGFWVVARLNHSYGDGTIPVQADYQAFADACAQFVSASQGCSTWIIGNEINCRAERPEQVITPALYADCFTRTERAIHAMPGHDGDLIIPAAIGPWNAETGYLGNEVGDWIVYFQDMLSEIIKAGGLVGGIALHTYTHGPDPALVTSPGTMGAPFEHRFYDFQCYREFMAAIPEALQYLPVIIAEANQNDPWEATGWIGAAYEEIDHWNHEPGNQPIQAMCLFRYPNYDKWHMIDKPDVLDEFSAVVTKGYTWNGGNPPMNGSWNIVYTNPCNIYRLWGDPPQINVLEGFTLDWDRTKKRPEMTYKTSPEREVYPEDPPHSGVGHLPYAKFDWWMKTETPITVSAGMPTKLNVALMIVAHGVSGDPNKLGDCGMIIGISPPDVISITDDRIVWSEDWYTVRDPSQPGANMQEYVWAVGETIEYVPQVGQVHLWIRCVANVAADISAGHFDLIQVLQKTDQPVPPPTGDYRVIVYDPDGNVVAETSFPGGNVNPQICSLAQQIQVLSCQTQTSSFWNKVRAFLTG